MYISFENIIMEAALFFCDHSDVTDRLISCTTVIAAINSHLHPTNRCDNIEQATDEIISAYRDLDYDDFLDVAEQYINYDDAFDVAEALEAGNDAHDFIAQCIEKQQKIKDDRDKNNNAVISRELALEMLETAAKAIGFAGIKDMGLDHHHVPGSMETAYQALVQRFHEEAWYR